MGFFDYNFKGDAKSKPKSKITRVCAHPGCGTIVGVGSARLCRRHEEETRVDVKNNSSKSEEKVVTKRPLLKAEQRPRLRIRYPQHDKAEPADPTFTWYLQEARLAKQIAAHWKHDQVLVAGAERIEREKWKQLIQAFDPGKKEDA